jgi:hypothetical protein
MKRISDLELRNKELFQKMEEIQNKAVAENRNKTDEESADFRKNADEIKKNEVEIEDLKEQAKRSTQFSSANIEVTENKQDKSDLNKFFRSFGTYLQSGVAPEGYRGNNANSFIIPNEILRGLTNTSAIGSAKEKTVEPGVSIAKSPALAMLQELGPKFVSRPVGSGDYVMSSKPISTASKVAEGVAGADASMNLTTVTLSPNGNRISVYAYFTVEEEYSLNPQSQADLIQDLQDAVWEQAAYNYFDNLEIDASLSTTSISTANAAIVYDDFVTLQEGVPYQLANPRYVAAPSVASRAKKIAQIASVSGPVWTGSILKGEVDGIPATGTPFANTDKLYYGDFSKSTICQWGGLEVQFNPFEKDAEGEVKVVARAIIDSGVNNYRYFKFLDASLS